MFWLKLIFINNCLFSGCTAFQAFITQFLTNSLLVKCWAGFGTSAATIKLAFTSTSYCDLALVRRACCDARFFFILCPAGVFVLCLLWCCISYSLIGLYYFIRATLSVHRRHTALPFTFANIRRLPPVLKTPAFKVCLIENF